MAEADAFAGISFIKAGTLGAGSWVKPGLRIWCDSAQAWGEGDDSMQQVGGNPG